ncbi:MAG TPA: hypothetical protein VD969_05645 [Symbiobacteriaceae bacterium]|nr:hypothetical protein [Symbiobacteriaceae bacterium]
MVYLIPKAGMHPVERYAVVGGLTLFGLGVAAAAYLMGNSAYMISALSVVSTLAVALNPADRMEYRVEPGALRAGKWVLPYREIAGARVVRLGGTVVYGGIVLPGYWSGRAWSRRLGHFLMQGSTGLGQGVMLTMMDGRRIVITPAHPTSVVVQVYSLMRLNQERRAPVRLAPIR